MDRLRKAPHEGWSYTYPVTSDPYYEPAAIAYDCGQEQDYPMDAFDRQLLASLSSGSQWHSGRAPIRYSLPSNNTNVKNNSQSRRIIKDDLLGAQPLPSSSSSPTVPMSSPTILALNNRSQASQRARSIVPDKSRAAMLTLRSQMNQPTNMLQTSQKPLMAPMSLSYAPPNIQGIQLIPTDHLPDHMRSIFSFELFNAVQSKCFSPAFKTNDNIVLSAPTGSGKTAVLELAICRLLSTNKNDDFKIVYQAPTRSLCSERFRDWTAKFNTLGLQCAELTGDVEHAQLRAVQSAQVIITTPEKWDSVTRKWRDNAKLMQMIKLFLIDEVHILNESRGATLEAVVSRMKSAGAGVRFVALSATVPNSDDIAVWLGRNPTAQHLPAHREVFDEAFRPVKLEKYVVGFGCIPNEFALDNLLTKEIPIIVARYAKRKPVMIFCVTKSSAVKTAKFLAELWHSTAASLRLWNPPIRPLVLSNPELQKTLPAGVAFHHGGLDANDRRLVEQGFLDGNINIICSTSTLAVGVNLPCYLVILKGTSCWSDNGLQEYSSLDVMQMLGRAGRPQFETSASAVILTHNEKVRHYEDLVAGQETLESSLHENLIEHLNAEIGIGTIHDIESARKWLASSFLSVRLRQNLAHYRLPTDGETKNADQLLEQICERDLDLLKTAHLIEQQDGFRCTDYGNAMTRYYIKYETMLEFMKLAPSSRISDILNVMSKAHEFKDLKLRSGEKSMYKELNKANDIRYPIKIDIALPAHKTSLIIQGHLGGVILAKENAKHTAQFRQDTLTVMSHCNRLIKCIIDMQICRLDATTVRNALELCRSMSAGVWDNTPMQLKQIESIGDVTARKLAAAGITTIDALLNTEPHRIEVVLAKGQPFGSALLRRTANFPTLRVSVKEVNKVKKASSQGVEIQLRCEIGHLNETLPLFFNRKAVYVCFLCETSYGKLVDFRRFAAKRLHNGEQICLNVLLDQPCDFIRCHVMCDEIAGTHRSAELKLDIPAEWLSQETGRHKNLELDDKDYRNEQDPTINFEDAELEDNDFLAAEFGAGKPDVIRVDTSNAQHALAHTQSIPKRKAVAVATDKSQGAPAKQYRVSVQLRNGNWTCQHTCREEGKECKHQCCSEGVKRPKKRSKTHASSVKPSNSIQEVLTRLSTRPKDLTDKEVFDIDQIPDENMGFVQLSSVNGKNALTKPTSGKADSTLQMGQNQHASHCRIWDVNELDSDDFPSTETILMGSEKIPGQMYDEDGDDVEDFTNPASCDWGEFEDAPILQAVSTQDILSHVSSRQSCSDGGGDSSKASSAIRSLSPIACPSKGVPGHKQPALITSVAAPDGPNSGVVDHEFDPFDDVEDADLIALAQRCRSKELVDNEILQGRKVALHKLPDGALNSKTLNDVFYRPNATELARQRQLHAEEQRSKWQGLPTWLYEMYGGCVDLE